MYIVYSTILYIAYCCPGMYVPICAQVSVQNFNVDPKNTWSPHDMNFVFSEISRHTLIRQSDSLNHGTPVVRDGLHLLGSFPLLKFAIVPGHRIREHLTRGNNYFFFNFNLTMITFINRTSAFAKVSQEGTSLTIIHCHIPHHLQSTEYISTFPSLILSRLIDP
jgi:hypothetical protein